MQKYEMIEYIWHDYINSDEYQEENDLTYDIKPLDDEKLKNKFKKEDYGEIENIVMGVASDAERIGFIQGFKLATKLMKECFS